MSEIRLRRASPYDVDYLLGLGRDEDIAPFLAAGRAATGEELLAEVERSLAEPGSFGRFLVEVADPGEWRLAGAIGFERTNRRSRIAAIGGLAIDPAFRGRGLGAKAIRALARLLFSELEYHRLEAEAYAFNRRALLAIERSGFIREGIKRRAFWRDPEWVDGVSFGLTREEFCEDLESDSLG